MKFAHTVRNRPKAGGCHTKARMPSWLLAALVVGCGLGCSLIAYAQTPADEEKTPAPTPKPEVQSPKPDMQAPEFGLPPVNLQSLPRNLFLDQKSFWSTPFHMTGAELQWAVPLAFAGAALVASDTAIEKHVPTNPTTVSHAVTASNAGLAAMAGVGGGMFLLGHFAHNDQEREAGLLSGEAGIDAFLDTEVFAYALGRERPFTGDGRGRFFQGGDSFPSQHAAISWAIASVIAHEYPGPLTELLAYGAAAGVSAARVAGQKHFASDVLLGSALGWYLGREVFRSHSQYSDADIAKWGTFSKSDRDADMRPWTRMECARQVQEASDPIAEDETQKSEAASLYQALQKEFGREVTLLGGGENAELRLESAYTRSTEIVGKPLTDGDHFGQTIVNDYGRPEEQGFNNVSGWAAYGPFAVYARGEYQHSPSAPALPLTARDAISQADFSQSGLPMPFPVPPDTPTPAFDQGRFLDTYVALNLSDWQISYGNQSLWWGPSHVPRQPGHTLYASEHLRIAWTDARGGLYRAIFRIRIPEYAHWARRPVRPVAESTAHCSRRENQF